MNISQLRELLAGMDGKARVLLYAPPNPHMGDQPIGRLLHVAVTRLDGNVNTITLSTCHNKGTPDGEAVFTGEATISVASASSADGHQAAADSLTEQLETSPAISVSSYLEGQQMRAAFQRLNNLIAGQTHA